MQEQNASKGASLVARIGMKNIIWLGIFSILMLAAAFTWLWPYRNLPTATWREANSTLPWVNEGIVVKDVKGHWESSAGNERLALRTAWYPVAEMELAESQGSGMIYVRFTDNNGVQVGDTVNLYYDKGNFQPRQETNIQAEGSKARVFVEAGFAKDNDFELHVLDESCPLWRVNLYFRPDGANDIRFLGSETIPAKPLP